MAEYTHEWLCRQIVEKTQDAVVFADREGIVRLWNSGAQAVFGFSPEEALGQTLDLIIPERLRERHWQGYRKVMETGETRYGREILAVPADSKDGSRISTEFTIVLITDDAGVPLGAAALMRDVTERWQREKELKKRLAEIELKVHKGR
jgi:PAS domain S-box-containing protein